MEGSRSRRARLVTGRYTEGGQSVEVRAVGSDCFVKVMGGGVWYGMGICTFSRGENSTSLIWYYPCNVIFRYGANIHAQLETRGCRVADCLHKEGG